MNTSSMRKTIRFPHSRATKGVAIPSLGSVLMPDKTYFIYCHWLSETCQEIRFLSYLYSLRWIASCQTRVLNKNKQIKMDERSTGSWKLIQTFTSCWTCYLTSKIVKLKGSLV